MKIMVKKSPTDGTTLKNCNHLWKSSKQVIHGSIDLRFIVNAIGPGIIFTFYKPPFAFSLRECKKLKAIIKQHLKLDYNKIIIIIIK